MAWLSRILSSQGKDTDYDRNLRRPESQKVFTTTQAGSRDCLSGQPSRPFCQPSGIFCQPDCFPTQPDWRGRTVRRSSRTGRASPGMLPAMFYTASGKNGNDRTTPCKQATKRRTARRMFPVLCFSGAKSTPNGFKSVFL